MNMKTNNRRSTKTVVIKDGGYGASSRRRKQKRKRLRQVDESEEHEFEGGMILCNGKSDSTRNAETTAILPSANGNAWQCMRRRPRQNPRKFKNCVDHDGYQFWICMDEKNAGKSVQMSDSGEPGKFEKAEQRSRASLGSTSRAKKRTGEKEITSSTKARVRKSKPTSSFPANDTKWRHSAEMISKSGRRRGRKSKMLALLVSSSPSRLRVLKVKLPTGDGSVDEEYQKRSNGVFSRDALDAMALYVSDRDPELELNDYKIFAGVYGWTWNVHKVRHTFLREMAFETRDLKTCILSYSNFKDVRNMGNDVKKRLLGTWFSESNRTIEVVEMSSVYGEDDGATSSALNVWTWPWLNEGKSEDGVLPFDPNIGQRAVECWGAMKLPKNVAKNGIDNDDDDDGGSSRRPVRVVAAARDGKVYGAHFIPIETCKLRTNLARFGPHCDIYRWDDSDVWVRLTDQNIDSYLQLYSKPLHIVAATTSIETTTLTRETGRALVKYPSRRQRRRKQLYPKRHLTTSGNVYLQE